MIGELKNRQIFEKVGGAFKVSALIQKRIAELMEGSRPLIENTEGKTMIEIVVEEIMQDKITPDYSPDSQKVEIPKL
jgi:DNA-directed RNA polymerase subunit omega